MYDVNDVRENGMAGFENLRSLLQHLETAAGEYARPRELQSLFCRLLGESESTYEQPGFDEILWEYNVFRLKFEDGELNKCYAHFLDEFTPQAYTYVMARLMSTTNPVLKHRYAHALWCRCDGQKEIRHATMAVDAYLRAAQGYETQAGHAPNLPYGLAMSHAIRNAYGLAARTNQPLAHIKAEILRMAKYFTTGYTWLFRVRDELITLILRERKHFTDADLSGLQDVCWDLYVSANLDREVRIQDAKDILDLGQKIDRKLGQTSHNWDLARAECYVRLMGIRKPGDCAVPQFCLHAIQNYRRAGEEDKARMLEAQYGSLADSVQLACVRTQVDMTSTMMEAKQRSEEVAGLSPAEVITFLVSQTDLLPCCDDIKQVLSEGAVDELLMDAPSAIIDDRGHLTERHATSEEREKRERLRLFGQLLDVRYLPIVHKVILGAIKAEKLSIDALREHLLQKSWLGKDIEGQSPTKGRRHYRWWDLLEPSLIGYFEKAKQWLTDPSHVPNLIVEIDSLTMKFEGMLRDLLRRSGVPTFQQKRQDHGLTEEKYVGKLLDTEDAKRIFSGDDLLFLQFLLTEDTGYDLRNRIAHCLLLPDDYSICYMHLLFLALLRLSTYDPTPPANGCAQTAPDLRGKRDGETRRCQVLFRRRAQGTDRTKR